MGRFQEAGDVRCGIGKADYRKGESAAGFRDNVWKSQ